MDMGRTSYSYGEQQQMRGQQQSQQPIDPIYDEAAFADAFEQASQYAQEIVTDRSTVDRAMEQDGSDLLHKDAIPMDRSDLDHEVPALIRSSSPTQMRIGSDAIPYQDQKTRTPDQDSRDADELARTAGQLLTSVQHDTSDKFQNSQFLALMRKIRDGEVRVEGEEFKETTGSDNTVSNTIGSVMQRAEKELNTIAPPIPIRIVVGFEESGVVLPTHSVMAKYWITPILSIVISWPIHTKPPCSTSPLATMSSATHLLRLSLITHYDQRYSKRTPTCPSSSIAILPLKPPEMLCGLSDLGPPDPNPLFMFAPQPFTFDNPRRQNPLLTNHRDPQNGLEDNYYQARPPGQADAHQLHPGGPYYPEQSPPQKRATMSGALGITADDLHHFDQLDESPGLSNRYQRPSVEDHSAGASASASA